MFPPGMLARRPALALVHLLAVGLALAGAVGGAWDLHHDGDAHCLQPGPAVACTATHPDAPLHAEATPSTDARSCAACLLRTQTRGLDLVAGLAVGPVPVPSAPVGELRAPAPRPAAPAALSARGPPASASLLRPL